MGYKREIKDNVRRLLYAKSGNVCAMYGCNNTLVHANTASVNEICHIEAVNESGARYNSNLTDEYVNSYENLLLLCPTCHSIIDDKLYKDVYTVAYLKQMKQWHEQQVQEALMSKAAIDPPLCLERYDVSKIVALYNNLFEQEISEEYVYEALNDVLSLGNAIRSIVYGIAVLCNNKNTEEIDVHYLNEMAKLDLYSFAEILMLLENQGIIKETKYIHPLDGYETENGDWHLVQNDYLYKTTQGTWYIKKRGKIFVVICSMFGNMQIFYDFMVNRNLELLKNIC